MPTGYTDIIDRTEGEVSFNKFAWRCARAFGAMVDLREEPLNLKLTLKDLESKPCNRNLDKLAEANQELIIITNLSDQRCEVLAHELYVESTQRFERYAKEKEELVAKYEAMRAKVMDWVPDEEHKGLKNFMLEQLSIGKPYQFNKNDLPKKMTAAEYRRAKVEQALHDISYYAKEHKEELERIEKRSKWTKELVDSIGMPE